LKPLDLLHIAHEGCVEEFVDKLTWRTMVAFMASFWTTKQLDMIAIRVKNGLEP
jgi:hypothetical protein